MTEDGWDVNEEYEKLFGASKHINLFDTDEEYEQLRQFIIDQPYVKYVTENLPFEGVELTVRKEIKKPRRERIKKAVVEENKPTENDPSTEKHMPEDPSRHLFFIKEDGVCDASGYYNEEKQYFYICKGSLVSYDTDLFYIVTDKEKARQNFIDKVCTEVNGYYIVIRDAKCRSAAAAASYVLGYQDDFTRWRDADGNTLSEIYPDIYFPLFSKKEKILREENTPKIEQIPQEEVKNTIAGRPPRYYYIVRENMGNRSCNAKGMYDKVNEQFVIAEGSVLSYDVTPTYRFTASDIKRKKFIQLNCGNSRTVFKLKRDAICSSPDEAACFVLGESANGWIEWKSKSGLSLESYINRAK